MDGGTPFGQTPERTLLEAPANLWRGKEAVGGRVTVTSSRIIFQSHGFNAQTGTTEIPLADIQGVTPVNTLGIVPNGVRIALKSGGEHRFVVWHRDVLMRAIPSALSPAP